jgi:protoporphyrinogen oxidase
MRRWYGDKIYEMTWRPMLIGKFGPHYQEANMAWMWARLHVRSPKLGYFVGGFQAFIDNLAAAVEQRGGSIHLGMAVQEILPGNEGLMVTAGENTTQFDRVLVTTSPGLLAKLAPELPKSYSSQLRDLKSMGAVVMTLALKQPLLTGTQTYWLNIPADSPDKSQNEIPFLALVEHTNYIDSAHYGGDTIVYCGDYVPPDHPYFSMSKEELQGVFSSVLHKFNPGFRPDWIRKSWLFREPYAQPVPVVNQSAKIPDIRTPLAGLYLASMSQVYPWDRGTNFAVEIGRNAAKMINEDASMPRATAVGSS